MEVRKLGPSGPQIGVIGLGTEHLERSVETMDAVLRAAVEAGSNYVDLIYVEPEYWETFGPVYRRYRDHLSLAAHWGSGPRYDLAYCQSTYCHHCLPCPEGIEIGWVIWYVDHVPGGDLEQLRQWYAGFPVKASACTECSLCLERCPFEVDVMTKLAQAVDLFETRAAA